jgi:hypothetical protein
MRRPRWIDAAVVDNPSIRTSASVAGRTTPATRHDRAISGIRVHLWWASREDCCYISLLDWLPMKASSSGSADVSR